MSKKNGIGPGEQIFSGRKRPPASEGVEELWLKVKAVLDGNKVLFYSIMTHNL